ncbi:hypothetical protein LJB88_00035 [Erysipelotrichaceae bacterium OttesenSCG-928-M19]|nr:hypothetical protein [Erysipelotrichaceae bacterium OttesenSCG-928-M19]
MKKIICLALALVFVLGINNNIKATEIITELEGANVKYQLTADGKVYASGQNTNGQLGLNLADNAVVELDETTGLGKQIPYLPTIKSISYDDYTLTLTYSDSIQYVIGKNGYAPKLGYSANYNSYLKNEKANYPQKITLTNGAITRLEVYQNYTLKKYKTITIFKTKQIISDIYDSNNIVKERRDFKYNSSGSTIKFDLRQYNVKTRKEARHLAYNYNSSCLLIKRIDYRYYHNKKRIYSISNYSNAIIRNQTVYNYKSKKAYRSKITTRHYNNKGKLIKKYITNYRSNKKASYRWYATYRPDLKIRLGVTKKYYNKRGKLTKIDAKVEGIKFYTQKDSRWRYKRCSKSPYNGSIEQNGCMLSSFSMINSIYNPNVNPGQLLNYGLDCYLDHNLAAKKFGYTVQNTYSTRGYTRKANTSFYNSKKLIKNNKSTYTIKDAITTQHLPVQLWLTPSKRMHRGHSVVAYRYIYKNGRWDIKIYDPYPLGSPSRSLKDLATRHYIAKAQVWERDLVE